jgi:GntR family transcriptional regulator
MPKKSATKVHGSNPALGALRYPADDCASRLYLRIARILKEEIVGGTYPIGARLPTENDLSKRFCVSRQTVREALRQLRNDELVASRQGAGTVVVSSRASSAYAQDVMSINALVAWALGRCFAIESMELIALSEALAVRTGLEAGEKRLAVTGFGREDGSSIAACWAEYYIHEEFAAVGRLLHRHSGPIFPLIEDRFGVIVTQVHQDIAATLIAPSLARVLEVEVGSAALQVQRTYLLANGQAAQVTISTHPAACYRHSMTLRRVRD